MLSKLVDRFGCKYILLAIVSMPIVSSSALAETGAGSLELNLEVVNQCNLPVRSYYPSSSNDNGINQVKVECSNKNQAVGVVINSSQTTDPTVRKSADNVNVSISY
jgi:hypothetical protein